MTKMHLFTTTREDEYGRYGDVACKSVGGYGVDDIDQVNCDECKAEVRKLWFPIYPKNR